MTFRLFKLVIKTTLEYIWRNFRKLDTVTHWATFTYFRSTKWESSYSTCWLFIVKHHNLREPMRISKLSHLSADQKTEFLIFIVEKHLFRCIFPSFFEQHNKQKTLTYTIKCVGMDGSESKLAEQREAIWGERGCSVHGALRMKDSLWAGDNQKGLMHCWRVVCRWMIDGTDWKGEGLRQGTHENNKTFSHCSIDLGSSSMAFRELVITNNVGIRFEICDDVHFIEAQEYGWNVSELG